MMTYDEFFAEAKRLNCRMVSDDPAEVVAASEHKAGDKIACGTRPVSCKHCGGTTGYVYQSKRMQLTSLRGKWGESPVALKTSVNVTESFAACCDCGVKYRVPALERGGLAGKPNVEVSGGL